MQKIVVIAMQTEEITKLCSEINKHGFQCSFIDGKDAIDGVTENTAGLLLIEFTGSPDIETICRYFHKEKDLPVIALVAPDNWINSMIWLMISLSNLIMQKNW